MKNLPSEIPENQIDIFEMFEVIAEESTAETFLPERANWKPSELAPQMTEQYCYVIGIIPEDILAPDERNRTPNGDMWGEQQDIWTAYVWGISSLIPLKDRTDNDINGWEAACEIFRKYRDSREPIKLRISEVWAYVFGDLEVIEYL